MRHSARAPAPLPSAVRRNKHYLACRAGGATKGATPTARNQERYRTAGRVLPRSPRQDPSSLKLRRDKAYLLDCLSRRNAMKPEATTTARPAPEKQPPSGGINTTLPVVPEARQKAQRQRRHGADGSCGKVAGKSRRRRGSGLMSSTEPATDDLPRDCPRAAALSFTIRRLHHRQYARWGFSRSDRQRRLPAPLLH